MTDAGILRPIDDLVATWEEEDPESFANSSSPRSDRLWDEQIMGMAYDASMDQIYYRADWWEEAGMEVPWQPATNAELLDTLRLSRNNDQMPFRGRCSDPGRRRELPIRPYAAAPVCPSKERPPTWSRTPGLP